MNQKLLIILPCCANDGVLAERLLDHCYKIHGKKQVGHLLIVANPDLHQEQRAKLRVTAEMAFESVTETVAPAVPKQVANSKFHQLNNLFRHAALTAQTNFRWPWFWLEPDCAITSPTWIAQIATDYDAQPKKYMGLISKAEKPFMARCGVYYPVASYELDKLCQGDAPFPLATSEKVIPSASHTDLVQYLAIETPEDLAKISAKAVVVHGDKLGLFAENWQVSEPMILIPSQTTTQSEPINISEIKGLNATVFPMQPQEIAKEIDGFLTGEVPILTAPLHPTLIGNPNSETDPLGVSAPKGDNVPRLSRRQKRELGQNGGK
jgi:hypothetical protein